jgi:glutamine cyclotransferase
MIQTTAEIIREYGPFDGVENVAGVTTDGQRVWFASGAAINAFDAETGDILSTVDMAAHAGTAFDGSHLYQLDEDRIFKLDPSTGDVLSTISVPADGSGLTWAEGTLWMGQHSDGKIHQIDPETGATLRTIESDRFVTGVTWADGDLWHATWQDEESELRRVDPATGEVLESVRMPPGAGISGLESDGADNFFCGNTSAGTVRVIRRPH